MNQGPWTGCYKINESCTNRYFYDPYVKRYGQNTIQEMDKFGWSIRKSAKGGYNIRGDRILATCLTTDSFLLEADARCEGIWAVIKQRVDIEFLILTKRTDRFPTALPGDQGGGYEHVNIECTVEDQEVADYRLPLLLSYPMKRRFIIYVLLLEVTDLMPYLDGVDRATVGGEAGRGVRICDYGWALDLHGQCGEVGKTSQFKNTDSFFRHGGIAGRASPFKRTGKAKQCGVGITDKRELF